MCVPRWERADGHLPGGGKHKDNWRSGLELINHKHVTIGSRIMGFGAAGIVVPTGEALAEAMGNFAKTE